MLTRKDFDRLAAALAAARPELTADAFASLVGEVSAVCKVSNPRFDPGRFLRAACKRMAGPGCPNTVVPMDPLAPLGRCVSPKDHAGVCSLDANATPDSVTIRRAQGWNDATMLELQRRYIDAGPGTESFPQWLQTVADEENAQCDANDSA